MKQGSPITQRADSGGIYSIKALSDKISGNTINMERAERRVTPSQPEAQGNTALQEAGAQGSPHPHLNHLLQQPRANKLTLHFTCLVLSEIDFTI